MKIKLVAYNHAQNELINSVYRDHEMLWCNRSLQQPKTKTHIVLNVL